MRVRLTVRLGQNILTSEPVRDAQGNIDYNAPPKPHVNSLLDRDIVWISSAGNYVEYSLANGSNHLVRGTLASAETQLARFNLVRIHRTRLANLDRVSRVQSKPSGDFDLTFDTGHTVQGSRRYRSAVSSLDRSEASI